MDVTETFKFDELSYLCDGWLQGDDEKCLPVHRILLATISPYFRTAFVAESETKCSNVCRVNGFRSNTLEQIIRFAVERKVTIAEDNIRDIISLADFLEINQLLTVCCDYIRSHLSTRNCVPLYETLLPLEHLGLTETCFRFIETHFEHLIRREVLSLSVLKADTLEKLLLSDDLNVSGERTVAEAVYLWIKFSPERTEESNRLLRCVRMDRREFSNFMEDLDSVTIKNCLLSQKSALSKKRPKRPLVTGNNLILKNTASNCICWITYDGKLDFCRNLLVVPFAPSVISGDSQGNVYLLDDVRCWVFHPDQDGIRQIPDMRHHARRDYGVAVFDGFLYIIGGVLAEHPRVKMLSVERFNPRTGQWSWVQNTQFPCRGPVAVLKGKIYALSFYYPDVIHGLISAERYDPQSNSWTLIAPIPRIRSFSSVFAFKEFLFVLGQHNAEILLMSYDPNTDKWSTFSEISEQLQHPRMTVVGDSLILYDASPVVTETRVFKSEISPNQWTETCDPLLQWLCHSKIIDCRIDLPNLKDRTAFHWEDIRNLITP